MSGGEDEYAAFVERQADNYVRTIQVLVCLDSAIRYHEGRYLKGSRFLPAQALQTSSSNKVSPGTRVRPDVVIQIDDTYGLVGDVKITASTPRDFEDAATQIRKYDDDLDGWLTPRGRIGTHDLCLVVGLKPAQEAVRRFRGATPYDRPFILLTAGRDDLRASFWLFERRFGRFRHPAIEGKFSQNVAVPLERLAPLLARAKFVDSHQGCVEYTMSVLWQDYFPQCPRVTPSGERSRARGAPGVRVDVEAATDFLRRQFGLAPTAEERQPTPPRVEWVRKAMKAFVRVGRARRARGEPGVYIARYSPRARNANLAGFARQVYQVRQRRLPRRPTGEPRQLTLLDDMG